MFNPTHLRKSKPPSPMSPEQGLGGWAIRLEHMSEIRCGFPTLPTHQFWFSRFMMGLKRRTGQVVKQDKAITIEVPLCMQQILEE
jgi:hypothetical protein